jgi:uncharacterized protein
MNISMYQASVPSLILALDNLAAILEKGAIHAKDKKIDPVLLINSCLYPDLFSLGQQVQITSDIARRGAAGLAGLEEPKFKDNETSFCGLIIIVLNTIAYLRTLDSKQIDGSEEKLINFSVGKETMTFEGLPYLLNFVLPNIYFHIMIIQNILRHYGVELGKEDGLGDLEETVTHDLKSSTSSPLMNRMILLNL